MEKVEVKLSLEALTGFTRAEFQKGIPAGGQCEKVEKFIKYIQKSVDG